METPKRKPSATPVPPTLVLPRYLRRLAPIFGTGEYARISLLSVRTLYNRMAAGTCPLPMPRKGGKQGSRLVFEREPVVAWVLGESVEAVTGAYQEIEAGLADA